MDSFYGVPRQPPVPTTINKIERIPVVPEVSVVENSFFNHPRPVNPFSFNSAIRPQNTLDRPYNNDSFHHKKHVRFKSPSNLSGCPLLNPRPHSLSNGKENNQHPLKSVPDLNGKTFKQIYMANIPDRHLDLSVFEPPVTENQARICDNSTSGPLEKFDKFPKSHECNHFDTNVLKSIENKRFVLPQKENLVMVSGDNGNNNLKSCNEIAKPSDEPTIKDLFRLIQQQNEQIMQLQRQVNNLKSSIRYPEPDTIQFDKVASSPTKKGLFSIDFQTTSVEVSFRPPQGKFRKQTDFLEPKIQEIVECDNSRDNQVNSLHLDESLHVADSYVSALPSIQIKMDEYQSSDSSEEDLSVNMGITFYKDLMDQVNNVLKKMQVQSECQMGGGGKKRGNELNGQTMVAVKQATLQHLKSIGVNLSPIQETNEITGGSDFENKNCDPSDVSFAVKQLLMKYLPDDKLTKAMNKQKEHHPAVNIKEKKKFKPTGAEFSLATLQYMKKYNIIDNRKLPELERKTTMGEPPRILDVTALKRQPKLL